MGRVLPILFNTDMVQAILDGRKTVTRRVVKCPPHPDMPEGHNYCRMPLWMNIGKGEYGFRTLHYMDVIKQSPFSQTRYFESLAPFDEGDILYVRETYCPDYFDFETQYGNRHGYKADYERAILSSDIAKPKKWIPSIHMPKEAARIWLRVKDVRAERLQDRNDAYREGICLYDCPAGFTWKPGTDMHNCYTEPMAAMKALWDSTVRKTELEKYGWDANPWVWVIAFERCGKPEKDESATD